MEYSELLRNEIEFYAHKDPMFVYSSAKALALLAEIDRLNKLTQWIPVSERLPEVGEVVLWSHPEWKRSKEGYLTATGRLKVWGGEYVRYSKAKWQPLPEVS